MGKRSKIVYGGEVLMDLTADTVEPDKLLKGFTAHGADGEPITGTCTYDTDTSEATAKAAEVLNGKTYGALGNLNTGSMPNNGAVNGTISTKDGTYTVPQGYHDGSGTVGIDDVEKEKLIPTNIREGVTVLGVVGSMQQGEGVVPQTKLVTPATADQTVLPDEGYTHLSMVVVKAIPYVESDNAAGGITVTIG